MRKTRPKIAGVGNVRGTTSQRMWSAGKGKDMNSPLEPPERNTALSTH